MQTVLKEFSGQLAIYGFSDISINAIINGVSDGLHYRKEAEQKEAVMLRLTEIKKAIQAIQKTLDTAHGGWRMLIGIGGAFALVGGAVGWFLEKLAR